VFQATCDAKSVVHWTSITYRVSLPGSASEARFDAVPGDAETWSEDSSFAVTVADVKQGGDPVTCTGGPGQKCAGDLDAHFANFADGMDAMTVRVDLSPAGSADTAVLESVSALYVCNGH
jgi:hypothetical protein